MIQFLDESPKITVIGSSSIDLVMKTPKTWTPNQTMIVHNIESFFGGKGANQAVGCARLGASVYFIGCVGMDPAGQQILRHLVEEGVNVGYVHENAYAESGKAYIFKSQNKNTILVSPAANYELKPTHIAQAEKIIEKSDLVLIQLEIPMEAVEYSINLAYRHQVKIGVYASPAIAALPEELIHRIDFIVAKETDVETLFGNEDMEYIMKKYPNKLFIRSNANDTSYFDGQNVKNISKNYQEYIQNTIGTGDAFTSGFAVALFHKNTLEQCVRFGNEIAHRVSLEISAQKGIPKRTEI